MENFLNNKIQDLSKSILAEKETLIKERIKNKFNEDVDLILEAQKQFPRLSVEIYNDDQSEHWFWNDKNNNKINLISFYPTFLEYTINNKYSVIFEYT